MHGDRHDERESLLADPDLKNIYSKMLEYLGGGDMSEKRLVARIVRLRLRYPESARYRRYSAENAWKIIPLLREDGYVDELRYARNVFNALKDKRDGLRAIRRKLFTRQIHARIVDQVIREFTSVQSQDLSKIRAAAEKKLETLQRKYGGDPVKKYQIRAKLYSWLASKGFSAEDIRTIIGNMKKGIDR